MTSSETLVSQGLPEAKLLACLFSSCTEMVIARTQGLRLLQLPGGRQSYMNMRTSPFSSNTCPK